MNKNNQPEKKNFPYDFHVELETRAHGEIVARCPLLPGCQAQGKTQKEALEKLKTVLDLYFTSATPAFFEGLEKFEEIPTFYDLAEFKGCLYAATSRDQVFKSTNGAPGSWKKIQVTNNNTKFFSPIPNEKDGTGDYTTQVYCLCAFEPP
ncbi:MAG TPA: type II toxin-antitoxin system HicB family antitoxin, partial [bacterium]